MVATNVLEGKCNDIIDSLKEFSIIEKYQIVKTLYESLIETMEREGVMLFDGETQEKIFPVQNDKLLKICSICGEVGKSYPYFYSKTGMIICNNCNTLQKKCTCSVQKQKTNEYMPIRCSCKPSKGVCENCGGAL